MEKEINGDKKNRRANVREKYGDEEEEEMMYSGVIREDGKESKKEFKKEHFQSIL